MMRRITQDEAIAVLIAHQRVGPDRCACGWSQWGASHAGHVWRMLRLAAREVRP